jgi:hypothetical protein
MTENEIMKALECCLKNDISCEYCEECPNLAMGSICMDNMMRDSLDLINRKNAENEGYKERFETLDPNSQMAIGYADALEERARAEAIKEFVKNADEVFGHYWGKKESVPIHDWLCVTARIMGVEL